MEVPKRTGWARRMVLLAVVAIAALAVWLSRGSLLRPASADEDEKGPAAAALRPSRPALPKNQIELTADQEKALGVKVQQAALLRGDHPITLGGKVSLDLEKTARIRPLLSSVIYEVKKKAGDEVKKGDALLTVESTDLGDAINAYQTALANQEVAAGTYRREALIRVTRATTETDYQNARAAFRTALVAANAAREKLLLLGVKPEQIEQLDKELPLSAIITGASPEDDIHIKLPDDASREADAHLALKEIAAGHIHPLPTERDGRRRARYPIIAPIDGTLIAKDAARGELIDPSQVIATVSDLSEVWINLDVYQRDIPKVRLGAQVDVMTPTYPDKVFHGTVKYLGEVVDDATHTLRARVNVDNKDRLLKSGMAAKTIVHCVDEQAFIEVPPAGIVRDGEQTYVLVKIGEHRYERRKVKLGFEAEDSVHVTEGLKEGEEVVVEGNLFIHTEIPLGN